MAIDTRIWSDVTRFLPLLMLLGCQSNIRPLPPRADSIAVADGAVCALDDAGVVGCAAQTEFEGLVQPPTDPVDSISGGRSLCALRDGVPVCWGHPVNGLMDIAIPTGPYVDVRVGLQGACGLKDDGEVKCWGSDRYPSPSGSYALYVPGSDGACGIRTDGTLRCVRVPELAENEPEGRFVDLAVGLNTACAISTARELSCWGAEELETPPGVWDEVTGTHLHFCVRRDSDNEIACFGTASELLAAQTDVRFAEQVTAGFSFTCVVDEDESTQCWGRSGARPPL